MLCRPGSGLPLDSNVRLPMMTGCPNVVRVKWAISSGRFHGNPPLFPMTRFLVMAQMREIR